MPIFRAENFFTFFQKVLDIYPVFCYTYIIKEREAETMKDYAEKCEILAYMVENGYCLANRTMDDYCRDFSLADIRYFCECFMGEVFTR